MILPDLVNRVLLPPPPFPGEPEEEVDEAPAVLENQHPVHSAAAPSGATNGHDQEQQPVEEHPIFAVMRNKKSDGLVEDQMTFSHSSTVHAGAPPSVHIPDDHSIE